MFGLVPFNRRNEIVGKHNNVYDFRSLVDEFFNDELIPGLYSNSSSIKTDIKENEDEYIIEAEIPGAKKEDIKLELKDDKLTISAEQSQEISDEKDNYIRKERRYGCFSRSFYVDNVKREDIKAKYENGILKVSVPKNSNAGDEKHRIEIQ